MTRPPASMATISPISVVNRDGKVLSPRELSPPQGRLRPALPRLTTRWPVARLLHLVFLAPRLASLPACLAAIRTPTGIFPKSFADFISFPLVPIPVRFPAHRVISRAAPGTSVPLRPLPVPRRSFPSPLRRVPPPGVGFPIPGNPSFSPLLKGILPPSAPLAATSFIVTPPARIVIPVVHAAALMGVVVRLVGVVAVGREHPEGREFYDFKVFESFKILRLASWSDYS